MRGPDGRAIRLVWACILSTLLTAVPLLGAASGATAFARGATQARAAAKAQSPSTENTAVRVVGKALDPANKLGIVAADLRTKPNPKGQGLFVYVPRTDYSGVKRNLLWVVLDGKAFALNAPSKTAAPSLPWPRETDAATWKRTGLDKFAATEAITLVWGAGTR